MTTTYADPRDFRREVVLDSPGYISDPIMIPGGVFPITVVVAPEDGASGRAEYTTDSPETIAAGEATWVSWPAGDVASRDDDSILSPVTAMRLNYTGSGTGTLTMQILGDGD